MNKLQINPVLKGDYKTRKVVISITPYLSEIELKSTKSQKAINHSPDGFAWGYDGAGPAQLALAILMIVCPKKMALELYQSFKIDIIRCLPTFENFELSFITIEKWLQEHE